MSMPSPAASPSGKNQPPASPSMRSDLGSVKSTGSGSGRGSSAKIGRTPSLSKIPAVNTESEFFLTSTCIEVHNDGVYTYDEAAFLIPHEWVRREMLRLEAAADKFDPIECPWKVEALLEWYTRLFYPGVHEHHDIEESIFFPAYVELGETLPTRLTSDHKTLMSMMDTMQEDLKSFKKQLDEKVSITAGEVNTFKTHVSTFLKDMREHLTEEEAFFPPIIRKHGEETYQRMEKALLKEMLSTGGEIVELVLIGVLQACGVYLTGKAENDYKGWACEEFQKKFLANGPPYPVRVLLMPGWERNYNYLKSLVVACQGSTPPAAAPGGGCACVIS